MPASARHQVQPAGPMPLAAAAAAGNYGDRLRDLLKEASSVRQRTKGLDATTSSYRPKIGYWNAAFHTMHATRCFMFGSQGLPCGPAFAISYELLGNYTN
jgi:hypothetical protein